MILIIGVFSTLDIAFFLICVINMFCITVINALFSVLVKMHFNTYLTNPYLFIFYFRLFIIFILAPF